MDDFIPRGLEVCEHRCCPPAVCEFVQDCDLHSVAPTVPLRGGQQGVSPRRGPGRDDHGATTAGAA